MAADGAATGVFSPLKALPGRTAPWVAGTLASAGFAVMVLFPILEAGVRRFTSWNFPSSAAWVQHLTLWLGILGAILASFLGRHLSIAVGEALRAPTLKRRLDIVGRGGAVGILSCLSWASLVLTRSQMASPETLGGWLPTWVAIASMPAGFAAMALATFWRSGEGWKARGVLIALALIAGPLVALLPMGDGRILSIVGVVSLVLLAGGGMPLFAVLGGAALLLFHLAQVPLAAVPAETYRIVTQPVLPSIPLFALAGVILARGGSPERLVRLVRAWTGWIPGGVPLATILACAFFTAITGASGVTILALGGLFFPILVAAKHNERFSLGLLTASGSVGLLFPPSLPVILYAVFGRVPIDRLFVAALLPGLLLLTMLGVFSVVSGAGDKATRANFELREAVSATRGAWGDLLLPVLIVVGLFGGFMTLVEVSALT
ncbi:MAG: TRAP transporter large permease subunit, partial [Longimicrobiales bacterium]|nr:TRAP transporter large permease subunit [Longimicrobiales bacterium]